MPDPFAQYAVQNDDQAFQKWYAGMAAQHGLSSNPDDPNQFYDYRGAFKAGAKPDATGHWPSDFKREGHPNMVVGGFNVQTGERVAGTKRENRKTLIEMGWDPATAARLALAQEPTGDPFAAYAQAPAPKAAPMQRSRTGQLYQPPADDDSLSQFTGRLITNLNPMNLVRAGQALYNDPMGTAGAMIKAPLELPGRLIGGDAPNAIADIATMFAVPGMKNAAAAVPGGRIVSAGWQGAKAAVKHAPVIGPPARAAYRAAAKDWRASRPTPSTPPAPPVEPIAAHAPSVGAAQSPFGGYAGPEVAPPAAAGAGAGAGPLRMAELSAKFGGTAKPKLTAPEVARMLREQYGSEKAGRMLYGKKEAGLNIISPVERQAAIKRLAPWESQLPRQAQQEIARKYADFQSYLAQAPNQRAREFILSLMKGE